MSNFKAVMPQHIDSTMITCSRSCLQKFKNEFIIGLRPPGISIDLHAGACFATALEIARKKFYGENKSQRDALEMAHAAFLVSWGDFEIPDYKKTAKTIDNIWYAVESYFARYPMATDHVQPYFFGGTPTFEFTFAIPLEPCAAESHRVGDTGRYSSYDPDAHSGAFPLHPSGEPWLYCGRFDMLGSYEGKPKPLDEKTTGRSISTGWADQWNLRNQFMGYTWACQESGIDCDGVVVRGVAIQKTQIGHAEAVKFYSHFMIERWKEQLRRDLWRIRRAWDTGYFDYDFADACTSYGNCMFMNACTSPSPESWYNDFEVRRWNPLHKNPVEGAKS